MKKEAIKKLKLPDAPGVYFFLGPRKKILYIGKATSIKNRVESYFVDDIATKRSLLIAQMVNESVSVEFTTTDSVLEALILEANLIRSHKPNYNTRSKDDKSYNHLIITNDEFPRILIVRGKDVTSKFTKNEIKYHFGPFTSGLLFKEALKIVRKLFQFYDTDLPIGHDKTKLAKGKFDFNRQIGLYPEVQSKQKYSTTIRHIKLFFEGNKKQIIKELETEMMKLAKAHKFEEAGLIKRRVFALRHITDVSLIKDESRIYRDELKIRIEAYDVAHLQGSNMVGVMVVIDGGEAQKNDYRKFKITGFSRANDVGALKEIFSRRITHKEWPNAQMIVVDGSLPQKKVIESVLSENNLVIPVVAVVKDKRHKPVRIIGLKNVIQQHKLSILLANSESHRFAISYHRTDRAKKIAK